MPSMMKIEPGAMPCPGKLADAWLAPFLTPPKTSGITGLAIASAGSRMIANRKEIQTQCIGLKHARR